MSSRVGGPQIAPSRVLAPPRFFCFAQSWFLGQPRARSGGTERRHGAEAFGPLMEDGPSSPHRLSPRASPSRAPPLSPSPQKSRSQKKKNQPPPVPSATALGSHRDRTGSASSVASVARQASLTELVKSVSRGEFHGSVLKAELSSAEVEVACLHDALRSSAELRDLNANELHAAEHERDELEGKLLESQAKNRAWEERVETVTAEFEERTRQWQNELSGEGSKWQQHSLSLSSKLSEAQAQLLEASEQRDVAVAAETRLKQALDDAKASLQQGWAAWEAREAEVTEARKEAAGNARRAEEKAEAVAAAQGALAMRGNELDATHERIREVDEVRLYISLQPPAPP